MRSCAARIPYRIPSDDELGERLGEVLAVLYLMFNEGYLTSGGDVPTRRDLAEDAAWLTALVARGLSGEPEPLGLLALIRQSGWATSATTARSVG